jgi:hypothetical protein
MGRDDIGPQMHSEFLKGQKDHLECLLLTVPLPVYAILEPEMALLRMGRTSLEADALAFRSESVS